MYLLSYAATFMQAGCIFVLSFNKACVDTASEICDTYEFQQTTHSFAMRGISISVYYEMQTCFSLLLFYSYHEMFLQ